MRIQFRIALVIFMATVSGCQSSPVHRVTPSSGYHYHSATYPHESHRVLQGVAGVAESTVEAAAAIVPMALHLTGHMFPGI